MYWKAASYGLRIIVMSLLLWGCVVLFRKGLMWAKDDELDWAGIISLIISCFLGIILMFMVFDNTVYLLQLW